MIYKGTLTKGRPRMEDRDWSSFSGRSKRFLRVPWMIMWLVPKNSAAINLFFWRLNRNLAATIVSRLSDESKRKANEWRRKKRARVVTKPTLADRERCQRYFRNNKASIYKQRSEKRRSDASYRIASNIRTMMWVRLGKKNGARDCRLTNLLGCSVEQFIRHLEENFLPGMAWSNYGRGPGAWNIDHIIPCAVFDLSKESEQKRCFHFSNMKPMWASDNLSKGKRMPKQATLVL